MKKIGLFISLLSLFVASQTYAVFLGDVDGNNVIGLEDAILSLQLLSGLNPDELIDNFPASLTDIGGDKTVGHEEAVHALQVISGIRFPRQYGDDDGDGFTENQGDCDDTNPDVYPGSQETCNGIDDNCNNLTDEDVTSTFYRDMDGDGYGTDTTTATACSPPEGYAIYDTDCDDTNPDIFPGAPEIAGDGIDQDCNGLDLYPSDGVWTGTFSTTTPDTGYYCYNGTFIMYINKNKVSGTATDEYDDSSTLYGYVTETGGVHFTVNAGASFWTFNGTLTDTTGSGTWTYRACEGIFNASKSD